MEPTPPDLAGGPRPVADTPPPRLVALFRGTIELDATALAADLRGLHVDLADATVTFDSHLGDVAWKNHRVRLADEAYPIGPAPSRESYLRIDKIMDVVKRAGCDAIHPGYGFLAENSALPRACAEASPPGSAARSPPRPLAYRQFAAAVAHR